MEQKKTALHALPYWGRLTAAQQALLEAHASLRRYRAGELLHGGSDSCLGQITVLSGGVRAYLLSEEGREITLFSLRRGELCILSASCILSQITFETHMAAMQDTEVLIVHLGAFEQLLSENIHVRCFLYELAAERFSQVMWAMQQILFKGFDRRLAAFLIGEYERSGSTTLRMTHEQIAQGVNSAREVVARMLKRFAADGLVKAERGVLQLTDIAGLRRLL